MAKVRNIEIISANIYIWNIHTSDKSALDSITSFITNKSWWVVNRDWSLRKLRVFQQLV